MQLEFKGGNPRFKGYCKGGLQSYSIFWMIDPTGPTSPSTLPVQRSQKCMSEALNAWQLMACVSVTETHTPSQKAPYQAQASPGHQMA